MEAWLYKWLPIIFGCHCKSERSFHYHGKPFPICARCTGELIGMIAAFISGFFYRPPLPAVFILMVPMIVDGLFQQLTAYESNNLKRVITGFLFGYSLMMLLILSTVAAFRFGVRLGHSWTA